MRYLCLIYSTESQWATMARTDNAVIGEYFAFTEQLRGARIPSARYGAIEVRPVCPTR
jgi:hypothetical protein